jgi:hypothetical protein
LNPNFQLENGGLRPGGVVSARPAPRSCPNMGSRRRRGKACALVAVRRPTNPKGPGRVNESENDSVKNRAPHQRIIGHIFKTRQCPAERARFTQISENDFTADSPVEL